MTLDDLLSDAHAVHRTPEPMPRWFYPLMLLGVLGSIGVALAIVGAIAYGLARLAVAVAP